MMSSGSKQAIAAINAYLEGAGGRPLKPIEVLIVQSAWEEITYPEVLVDTDYSLKYIGGPASTRFWKYLYELFGIRVTKNNLKAFFQQKLEDLSAGECAEAETKMEIYGDRLITPKIFCGRSTELQELKSELQNARCVHIYGQGGIGKSTLVKKLIKSLQDDRDAPFKRCIWKSIYYDGQYESAEELLLDVLKLLEITPQPSQLQGQSPYNLISLLEDALRESPTLIVLDGIDGIPSWADQFKPLLRRVCDSDHDGGLITTGRSPSTQIRKLKALQYPVFEQKIDGLSADDSIQMLELSGVPASINHKWQSLADSYGGNPRIILASAQNISDLHGGKITNFYNFKTNFETDALGEIYQDYFEGADRLSFSDKKVIEYLLEQSEPVTVSVLAKQFSSAHPNISYLDLTASLKFLVGCSFLLSNPGEMGRESTFFTSPTFKNYLSKYQVILA